MTDWEQAMAEAEKLWADVQAAGSQQQEFDVLARGLCRAKAEALREMAAMDIDPTGVYTVFHLREWLTRRAAEYERAAEEGKS